MHPANFKDDLDPVLFINHCRIVAPYLYGKMSQLDLRSRANA